MQELEEINRSAYWDYQRERIYIRVNKQAKRKSNQVSKKRRRILPINTTVECPEDSHCIYCGAEHILKYGRATKAVEDIKFSRTGVKRWVVRYYFNRYLCWDCRATFVSQNRPLFKRFGLQLLAYAIYQVIELQIPQRIVSMNLNELFGFCMHSSEIKRQKSRAASLYKDCYEEIIKRILRGKLVHADETKISIAGESAYVWVITNLDEVAYLYSETREGEMIQSLLKDFKGVLVSDFYSAYDSIDCPQQKCLIHLIRDLNDDLHKQAFNDELKEFVRDFATLLRQIVETIDRFGLKAYFLRKHKVEVARFYKKLCKRDYRSEIAKKYRKRFERYQDKLFTFLDYDGVPWNNNNAEHAIKSFVRLRKVIRGTSTERGIQEYLILLSICETCKSRGVKFFDFLRSGEKDLNEFIKTTQARRT